MQHSEIRERIQQSDSAIEIFAEKVLMFDREIVDKLYPKLIEKEFFSAIARNYLSGQSIVVGIRGAKGVNDRINALKGKFSPVSGLRRELGAVVVGRDTGELEVHEFRLHTSDSDEEARAIFLMTDLVRL